MEPESMTRAELENACDERDIERTPEMTDADLVSALMDHEQDRGERTEEAGNEAYYGGDSSGSYGPDDPHGR